MTQKNKFSELIDNSSFDFAQFQKEAIEKLKKGQSLTGEGGILTPLIKQIVEASLEAEIEHHMDECDIAGIPNRRNGKNRKQVKTSDGSFELETPRDRNSSFEPELVKK